MAEVFLVCTAFRPNFLADRPISPLIEVHLARANTKTTQNGPFIFGLFVSAALSVIRQFQLLLPRGLSGRGHLLFPSILPDPRAILPPSSSNRSDLFFYLGATCVATRHSLFIVSVRG